MSLLLGIDLGTSYFKVGLFEPTGVLRGLGRVAVEPESPGPDRIELTVASFWERLRRALTAALAEAGASANEIAGISYSSQANTFVLLDADGSELTPLVFWNDQRARSIAASLVEFGDSPERRRITGLTGIAPGCAPAKWRWFAQHEPAVWSRTRHAMTISDYLTFSLTGERCGDAGTAALTGLYSLPERAWWPEALEFFGIAPAKLSRPRPPGVPCGRTTARAAELLGLRRDIPFAVGTLDHHAAALGSGIGTFADASLSTGTVLAALVLVDDVSPARGCIHGPDTDGKRYYRLAFDPAGAGQLEDYQRRFASDLTIEELLSLAKICRAEPGRASGNHGAAVRALLERIVTAQCALLRTAAGAARVRTVAATGGGARSPFLLQMQADFTGLPIVTSKTAERACLGAALFAAVAAGFFSSIAEAARAMVRPSRTYTPDLQHHRKI
ncbi:MAG: FGGY-family carbohydrate kinase [Opitutaceae bacterium]